MMPAPTGRSASGGGACQARKGTTARRGAWRGRPGCRRGPDTRDWARVPGAAGYLVYRAAGEPYEPLDHGGGDVLAVPAGPYADTSGEPGRLRRRGVAGGADGTPAGRVPAAVGAAAAAGGPSAPAVTIEVVGPGSGELQRPW